MTKTHSLPRFSRFPRARLARAGGVTTLASCMTLMACGAHPAAPAAATTARTYSALEADAIDAAQRLTDAADRRDADALEGLLHPQFKLAFTTAASGEVGFMSRAAYLGGIREGRLGGTPRTMQVVDVDVHDAFAHVEVTRAGAGPRFESALTFVRGATGWQLLDETTVVRPITP